MPGFPTLPPQPFSRIETRVPGFPTLTPRRFPKKSRLSQRDFNLLSVKSRNIDVINFSKTFSTSVEVPSGQDILFTLKTESSLTAKLVVQENISLFETSVSAANLIPNGSAIDASEFQIIGPWREYVDGDGKNIVSKLYLRNLLGVSSLTLETSSSSDDGYETNNASWSGAGTTLLIGKHDISGDDYDAGVRFQNVTIPHGSQINSATLILTQNQNYTFGADVYASLYGIDEDDTATFSGGDLPSSRTPTTASLINQQLYTGPQGDGVEDSFVVTSIIQEITGRAGWSSGNDLGFYINGVGPVSDGYVDFYTYDNGSKEPRLEVSYSTATSKTIKFRAKMRFLSELHDDISVTPTLLFSRRISASSDDAHDNTTPFYSHTSNSVVLGEGAAPWTGGFRFTNVQIPRNATIISAKLTFLCHGTLDGAGDAVLKYYAEAADNSATFSSGSRPSGRSLTVSFAQQTLSSFPPPTVGQTFESPDISSVINEVVGRPGWSKGSALSIIVDGASSSANNSIDMVAYDEDTTTAALLTVEHRL